MNINKSYKALLEGRISKSEFLRQARQGLPQYISNATSFEDAVKILRQKSILAESLVYQNKGDQFPLESIERGIRYELEEMDIVDVNSPTREEYKEAKQRAIDNLCKDPLYYIYKIAGSDFKRARKNEKEVENDDKMKKVVKEAKDLAMHKDIDLSADPDKNVKAPTKKPSQPRRKLKDNHDWTVNDYKVAYILAEFGTKGADAIRQFFNVGGGSTQDIANCVIGTTKDGLQFAITGMRKIIVGQEDLEGSFCQSYFHNTKSLEAARALQGKSFEECMSSLAQEVASPEEQQAAKDAETIKAKGTVEKKKEVVKAETEANRVRDQFVQQFGIEKGKRMYAAWLAKHPEISKYLKEGKYTNVEEAGTYRPMDYKQRSDQKPERPEAPRKVSQPGGSEDERKANSYFLELYCKYRDGKYQVIDPNTKEKVDGKPLEPVKAAQRACIMVRKAYNLPRFRPNRDAMANLSVGKYKVIYQGEQDGKPTFNQSWDQTAASRGRAGQVNEDDMEEGRKKLNKDEGDNNSVYGQIYRQLKNKYPDKKEHDLKILANKVYANYQKKQGVNEAGYQPYRGSARGGVERVRAFHKPEEKPENPEGERLFVQLYTKLNGPEKALKAVRKIINDPFWKPSRTTMKNLGIKWLDPVKGTFADANPTWREGKEVDIDRMVLKESIIKVIGKVLNEAATTNLAQFSDENASIADLPAAINSLENVVTEIESFWLKEQQKIQGIFDSLGNIKNEDGMPIGYKFAQPILESLKKDLAPVLEKITLDSLNLPEAPAPDQTQVNDPNAEVDPNAVPPVPEKQTVFSPAKGNEEPLQESKKNRRYTK